MRLSRYFILVALFPLTLTSIGQTVPYNLIPDWISTPNGHVATGLGLADINGDGWKDLIAANGNDIYRQKLVVYYNNGDGTFPSNPGWESSDIDYHGHLACGDIDHDGDMDVAVSVYLGAGGFGSPGKVKVYYNEGTSLEAMPSFVSNPFYTFSCTLGDADGDGDLDLATTGGEPYGDLLDHGKIFINNGGTFQPDPEWQSDILMGSLDVEFGDINRDGLMDIIFVCENTDNYIYTGTPGGGISNTASWNSAEAESFINSVDIGYRGDDQCLVVMTENDQLGGEGRVRSYHFSGTLPGSSQANWYSNPFGYGSGIALADLDLDSELDLVYGGWWLPVKVALWTGLGFQMEPEYTSSTNSVVEAIQMADLGRESVTAWSDTITIGPTLDGSHMLILSDQLVEEVISVSLNGTTLGSSTYCTVPNKPWISVGQAFQAGDEFIVQYTSSPHPDMAITNWDSGKGNYIFYNTNPPVGQPEHSLAGENISLFPNPVDDILSIRFSRALSRHNQFYIIDMTGRIQRTETVPAGAVTYQVNVEELAGGIYLLLHGGQTVKFIK